MSGRGKGAAGVGRGGAVRHRRVLRDTVAGITRPAIRRLARRGGVKRLSGLVYDETRGVLRVFLKGVVQDAVAYAAHAQRKTVTAVDVLYALKRQGHTLWGFGDATAGCTAPRCTAPRRGAQQHHGAAAQHHDAGAQQHHDAGAQQQHHAPGNFWVLTPEQAAETRAWLAAAIAAPLRPVARVRGVPVPRGVLQQLTCTWADDEIVDAYCRGALARSGTPADGYMPPKLIQAFLGKLQGGVQDTRDFAVRTYARYYFVPLHVHGNHWILAVLRPAASTVQILDSLGGNAAAADSAQLLAALNAAYPVPGGNGGGGAWTRIAAPANAAQQPNTNDCAFFTAANVESVLRSGHPLLAGEVPAPAAFRLRIARTLLLERGVAAHRVFEPAWTVPRAPNPAVMVVSDQDSE